jgi:hypothetical protein
MQTLFLLPLLLLASTVADARTLHCDATVDAWYSAAEGSRVLSVAYRVSNVQYGSRPGRRATQAAPFVLVAGADAVVLADTGERHSYFYDLAAGTDYAYAGCHRRERGNVTVGGAANIVTVAALVADGGRDQTMTWSTATGKATFEPSGWQQTVTDLGARADALGPCRSPFDCAFVGRLDLLTPVQVEFSLAYVGIGLPPGWSTATRHLVTVGDLRVESASDADGDVCREDAAGNEVCGTPVWTHDTNDTVVVGLDTGLEQLVVHWRARDGGRGTVLSSWTRVHGVMDGRTETALMLATAVAIILWFVAPSLDELDPSAIRPAVARWIDRVMRVRIVLGALVATAGLVHTLVHPDWSLRDRLLRASMNTFTGHMADMVTTLAMLAAGFLLLMTAAAAASRVEHPDVGVRNAVYRTVLALVYAPLLLVSLVAQMAGGTLHGYMIYVCGVTGFVALMYLGRTVSMAYAQWRCLPRRREGTVTPLDVTPRDAVGFALAFSVPVYAMVLVVLAMVTVYPFVFVLEDLETYRWTVTGALTLAFATALADDGTAELERVVTSLKVR